MERNIKMSEHQVRVNILYEKYYKNLIKYSIGLTQDEAEAEDLVSNLILYLLEKPRPNIYYKDSYNLLYLTKIIYCRYIDNLKNKSMFYDFNDEIENIEDEEYDYSTDNKKEEILEAYINIINSLKTESFNKFYVNFYIKNKLYKMSMNDCSTNSGKSRKTIYSHFKKMNEFVETQFQKKLEEINKKYMVE